MIQNTLVKMTWLMSTQDVVAHLNVHLVTQHKKARQAYVSKHVTNTSNQVKTKHMTEQVTSKRQNIWQHERVPQQVMNT